MDALKVVPIGHVVCPVAEPTDEGWGSITSRVRLLPEYRDGLIGIDAFSHALVVTWLHRSKYEAARHLQRRPRGLESMPLVGIFAQRAKDRPNPIGITAVSIVGLEEDALVVRGLDAIDGTPVVDLKPYYPAYDEVKGARVPEWVDRLMTGYF